jgi:hypothetical protein
MANRERERIRGNYDHAAERIAGHWNQTASAEFARACRPLSSVRRHRHRLAALKAQYLHPLLPPDMQGKARPSAPVSARCLFSVASRFPAGFHPAPVEGSRSSRP